jgi:hypothetical protein
VQLEGLGKLKKSTSSGTQTGDLPACSIVPQPTTLPRAPENTCSDLNCTGRSKLGDLHFNQTWSAAFPGQCECIRHGALHKTLDVSTGDVYTMSHGFLIKAVFVFTVLQDTGLPTERLL